MAPDRREATAELIRSRPSLVADLLTLLGFQLPAFDQTDESMDSMKQRMLAAIIQGHQRGRARGEANAILQVLAARGVVVSEDARARIASCTDADQLGLWLRRAVTAETIRDLFA